MQARVPSWIFCSFNINTRKNTASQRQHLGKDHPTTTRMPEFDLQSQLLTSILTPPSG